jgi:BirA family biotin operon repressor/biotin-[acetyl-CoA-carboxylase] ligase
MLEAGPYESVARALAGTPFSSIAYVEETESTNADAAPLLEQPLLSAHTIVAEYQRRGAARKGRTWIAPAGTSLLFTTVLPGSIAAENLWLVPYWVALGVRGALVEFGIDPLLQWPNDLLLGDRKIAGVLCRSCVVGSAARVACGVGINVRRPALDPGIEPPPAYCDDAAPVDRAELLRAILGRYAASLALLERPERVCDEWHEGARLPGERYRIQIDGERETFEAIGDRLVSGGGLRVLHEDGRREVISLADARVLRQP